MWNWASGSVECAKTNDLPAVKFLDEPTVLSCRVLSFAISSECCTRKKAERALSKSIFFSYRPQKRRFFNVLMSRKKCKNVNTRCRIADNFFQINYFLLFYAMKNLSLFPSSSLFPVFSLLFFCEIDNFLFFVSREKKKDAAAMVDNGKRFNLRILKILRSISVFSPGFWYKPVIHKMFVATKNSN